MLHTCMIRLRARSSVITKILLWNKFSYKHSSCYICMLASSRIARIAVIKQYSGCSFSPTDYFSCIWSVASLCWPRNSWVGARRTHPGWLYLMKEKQLHLSNPCIKASRLYSHFFSLLLSLPSGVHLGCHYCISKSIKRMKLMYIYIKF